MLSETLGRIAYEKWSAYQERMTANWKDLPQESKEIWEAIAIAVVIAWCD